MASWPPSSPPIAHGEPGSPGFASSELLRPLRLVSPIGWIGRQVEDVEAELGELRQTPAHALEAAERAREELVPGAEAGANALHVERQAALEAGGVMAVGVALHGREQLGAEHGVVLCLVRGVRVGERDEHVLDQAAVAGAVAVLHPVERLLQQHRSLRHLAAQVVLPALELAAQLVAPGGEQVRPRLDRELPAADPVDLEGAGPAVAVHLAVDPAHRRLAPAGVARPAVADLRAQDLVAVAEHVGGHLDPFADGPLGGEAAAVDHRRRAQDLDAGRRSAVVRPREHGPALARLLDRVL